jgi:hypothetical protein
VRHINDKLSCAFGKFAVDLIKAKGNKDWHGKIKNQIEEAQNKGISEGPPEKGRGKKPLEIGDTREAGISNSAEIGKRIVDKPKRVIPENDIPYQPDNHQREDIFLLAKTPCKSL